MARFDKVTKEFFGGTESGSETEKHFSLVSGKLSQDSIGTDEAILIANSIVNSTKQSKAEMIPSAEEKVKVHA